MSKRERQLDRQEIISEYAYARDLFVQLFRDEIPLVNLGYNSPQRTLAKLALLFLEKEEGELRLKPQPSVFFGDEGWFVGVQLTRMNRGGYYAYALYDTHGLYLSQFSTPEERRWAFCFWEPKIRFFEDDYAAVAEINMIPGNVAIDDIDTLVGHLYEGRYGEQVNMKKISPISVIKTRITPSVATYRAAWTDDETKLELVVESNHTSKATGDKSLANMLYVWRRLPTQNLQGQKWIPFGRKPNISESRMKKILEAKKEKMVTGQLAWQSIKYINLSI